MACSKKTFKKLGDLFQQNMSKSQAIIDKSKVSIPFQISPRHVTWQLPKEFSLEKFKAHKQIRFLESSFIRPTSETYLQIGHGQELESFIKLLKKDKSDNQTQKKPSLDGFSYLVCSKRRWTMTLSP